jgi:hypothetical protein
VTFTALGHSYPALSVEVLAFPGGDAFASLYPTPPGLVEDIWPPTQLTYLGVYLQQLGCKTIVHESHYIDRDYIEDLAMFYGRSLRDYPNHCQRLHFFSNSFSQEDWRAAVVAADKNKGMTAALQEGYLGFSVYRPLPGAPVGRTILRTFGPSSNDGRRREFGAVRIYEVHVAGIRLSVLGLAFQQQDRGVSACATAALWCAIQKVAPMEGLPSPSPATITEAASRYVLFSGRSLPSEGLTVQQVCEAARAAGLSPILVESTTPDADRAQLLAYLSSGFAAVLAITDVNGQQGHAVCAVGLKLGEVLPQTDVSLSFRDASSAVEGVYVHDDRLGPYASAQLESRTIGKSIRTALQLRWPDQTDAELMILKAIVVPVPAKLRLTVSRMRALGNRLADAIGQLLGDKAVTLGCRYRSATEYREAASAFGLSDTGLYELNCHTVLSRYVGVIELSTGAGPMLDFLLDATESGVNPAVLSCVVRGKLEDKQREDIVVLANVVGTKLLS